MDIERIAPELRGAVRRMPAVPFHSAWARRLMRAAYALMPAGRVEGVRLEEPRGAQVRVHRPDNQSSRGALLWIHGGGYLIGRAVQDDGFCAETAKELGLVVVAVDYRKAPEHPFPAALDDCFAAWTWSRENASALGVEPDRIVVGGLSAGGGLAAALAQRLHDAGTPALAQWLFHPMLDDRTAANTSLDALKHYVWSNRSNRVGWASYLAAEPGGVVVPPYAVPARREDVRGLPPMFLGVGDVDLFYDEGVAYGERLRAAGVDVTLDLIPGAPHGFVTLAPDAPITRAHLQRARAWLGGQLE